MENVVADKVKNRAKANIAWLFQVFRSKILCSVQIGLFYNFLLRIHKNRQQIKITAYSPTAVSLASLSN